MFATAGTKEHNPNNVRVRVLRRAVERASERLDHPLPDRLTPHSLGRTFASLLFANGDELPYVMSQLGHADPKMTLGVYAQVMQRKDGEQERFRALVNGAEWAPSGTGADSGASDAASRELPIRSRIAASGA